MSQQLDLSGCRKRKKPENRVFKFKTFGESGCPLRLSDETSSPLFEDNVRALLELGQIENEGGEMASWSFQLEVHRHPSLHVFLFVVEEPVELSLNPHCRHCQIIGWGHHLICHKKYHFVLPSKDTILPYLNYQGTRNYCVSSSSSTTCVTAATKSKSSNLIELEGHTLHGVFHSNGFGHLLCINGIETTSDLAGHQLMDFWDRLCTTLGARKVSLRDTSQKRGMELRLIHAVAYGEPWFGRWGYSFGRGSYGVDQQMYRGAVEALQNLPLSLLVHHHLGIISNNNHSIILETLSRYQVMSGHSLATLGDLFHFMFELKSSLPANNRGSNNNNPSSSSSRGILVDSSCRWSPKRVEMAIRVIIDALKKAEYQWVSRQQVRDAARTYIGDTGLLDFVLKSLGNHVVGRYYVRRCLNPVTKVLEYCLEDVSHTFLKHENLRKIEQQTQCSRSITRAQLVKDIYNLYNHVLLREPTTSNLSTIYVASRIILDTKYLVKEFTEEPQVEKSRLYCTVVLENDDHEDGNGGEGLKGVAVPQPYEGFLLKRDVTFDELRSEVERRFRRLYWGAGAQGGLVITQHWPVNLTRSSNTGTNLVFKQVAKGEKLIFKGRLTCHGGDVCESTSLNKNRVVNCPCGTKEDDGERMVSCDICDAWQHTRCLNIPNTEEIPNIFLCSTCEQELLRFPSPP